MRLKYLKQQKIYDWGWHITSKVQLMCLGIKSKKQGTTYVFRGETVTNKGRLMYLDVKMQQGRSDWDFIDYKVIANI